MNKEIIKIKEKIIPILKKNKVTKAGIFGSYARGEQKASSDVDILIEVDKKSNFDLFDLVDLEMELIKILNKKVDLLTYNGINHLLRDIILNEEVRII